MAGNSIDGLVSGMSTSQVISQLMQIEAIPQQKLKAKVTAQGMTQTALQAINTKMKALFTAAEAAAKPDAYTPTKATSSSDAVTAAASNNAATGTLTFEVRSLAQAQVTTATFAAATTPAVDLNVGLSFKINGGAAVPITVDPTKNTPQGVAEAINAAGLDVKAAAVDTGDNKIVLQLTSTKTGTAADFEVFGLTSPALPATVAKDAEIVVGTGAGAYSAFSNTNSFGNLMSGVTLTVAKTAPSVTVEVTRDAGGVADKVRAMVDAANAALADIELKADPKVASSPLRGNAMVRQMASSILSAVAGGTEITTNGVTSLQSFKSIGVELNKDGRLSFNKDAFVAAYTKDPAAVQKVAQDGLAPALKKIGDSASNSTTGAITQVLKTGDDYVRRLKDQITAWDARLELRQTNLKRQYSGLEVALGKLQQQSSWLSGQLAGLG